MTGNYEFSDCKNKENLLTFSLTKQLRYSIIAAPYSSQGDPEG